MKNLFIFILSFFACLSGFAQDLERRYFENNPELGGDVLIKSSSFKTEKDEIHKTFEIESSAAGAYYMDAWIIAPFTKDGYVEYKVAVNGVLTEFTFKPQTDGWHSLALTNVKKSAAAVNLKKGVNTVSVIGKGPEVPNVEFIKLSSNLSETGISDTNYRKFVESIKSGTLNKVYTGDSQQMSSGRGTNGQIYNYYLDLSYNFTQWWATSFSAGQNISISAGSSSFPCVIELFHISNPDSYSWSAGSSIGPANLTTTIPVGGSGSYILLIRSLNPGSMGLTTTTICYGGVSCSTINDCIVTYSPQVAVTPGYSTPSNFFACKTQSISWLFLGDNSGRIRVYNKDGGTTSDGYYWGTSPRISTNLSVINYGMVFKVYVYTPNYDTCDLYMGLDSLKNNYYSFWSPQQDPQKPNFPNLVLDNTFVSGPATPNILNDYVCYDWSVGETSPSGYPPFQSEYESLQKWDKYYADHGYTPIGADSINAAIAILGSVYGGDSVTFSHAMVRKHSMKPIPHGFEWESKMIWRERIMHTKKALIGGVWGNIIRYYKPDPNKTVNSAIPAPESVFSASDLNKIAALKNQIPATVLSGFEEKYQVWKKTWSRPELVIHNNPFRYAESTEYEDLLEYGLKFGKAVWPLLFDKLAPSDIFVVNLLKDLTYSDKRSFGDDIAPVRKKGELFPSTHSVWVDYCKGLLAKEEANIQNAIRDISAAEKETFKVNISVSGREIQLNLYSVKDNKASVKIFNVFGGLEFDANYNISKGNQMLAINASELKKGIYVVQITMGGQTMSQTISI